MNITDDSSKIDSVLVTGEIDFSRVFRLIEKAFFLIGGLLYLVFAMVVVRQISLMKKTIITDLSPTITLLGLIHLAASIAVFVGFLLFL